MYISRPFDIIFRVQVFNYDFPVSRNDFKFFKCSLVFPSVVPVKYAEYFHLGVETVQELFYISSARHPLVFCKNMKFFSNMQL